MIKKLEIRIVSEVIYSPLHSYTAVTMLLLLLLPSLALAAGAGVGGNVTASSKKGVCIAPEYFQCGDTAALPGAAWWYNWGTQPSQCGGEGEPAPGPQQWHDGGSTVCCVQASCP